MWYADNDSTFCSERLDELRGKYESQWGFECTALPGLTRRGRARRRPPRGPRRGAAPAGWPRSTAASASSGCASTAVRPTPDAPLQATEFFVRRRRRQRCAPRCCSSATVCTVAAHRGPGRQPVDRRRARCAARGSTASASTARCAWPPRTGDGDAGLPRPADAARRRRRRRPGAEHPPTASPAALCRSRGATPSAETAGAPGARAAAATLPERHLQRFTDPPPGHRPAPSDRRHKGSARGSSPAGGARFRAPPPRRQQEQEGSPPCR